MNIFVLFNYNLCYFIKTFSVSLREHPYGMWQVELHEDRKVMLKYGQIGRNLTIICAVFIYTGGSIFHTILQYKIGTFIDEHNRTIKPVVYPTYNALFDVQKSPIYELVYLLHSICGYIMYSVTAGSCGLTALFATHACGQIDIVIARLNDLIHGKYTKNTFNLNTRLVKIVKHHLRILRYNNINLLIFIDMKKFLSIIKNSYTYICNG